MMKLTPKMPLYRTVWRIYYNRGMSVSNVMRAADGYKIMCNGWLELNNSRYTLTERGLEALASTGHKGAIRTLKEEYGNERMA